MKKTKMLVSIAAATIALLATYTTAFATTIEAYTVKDAKTGVVRLYDFDGLIGSLISSELGLGDDLLVKDFAADQTANGVNSIYDDSKKYVPFEEAKKALEDSKTTGQAFDLIKYLKDAKAGETPTYVYERKVKGDKVVNGLNITKEGAQIDLSKEKLEDYEDVKVLAGKIMITNGTIKGKLVVDAGKDAEVTVKNVTGDSITGLSGSLKLEGVVAKELVIEKAITLNVDTASTLTKLVITAPKGSEVVLSGNLGTVELNSAVKLTITEGTKVDIKVVTEEAKETTVVAEKGAEVTTDKPIENVEGEGTVTTDPGTGTGGNTGGSSGGDTGDTTQATINANRATLATSIADIISKVDALDNEIDNGGNITTSVNGTTVTATVANPSKNIYNSLITAIPAHNSSTTVAQLLLTMGQVYTASDNLRASLKANMDSTSYNSLRNDAINSLKALMTKLNDNTEIDGLVYTEAPGFIQNLAKVIIAASETQLRDNTEQTYTLSNDIVIKGYTVKEIKIGTTTIYSNTTKEISKAKIREAFGFAANESYKDLTFGELASKDITITLTTASPADSITYTIDFQ